MIPRFGLVKYTPRINHQRLACRGVGAAELNDLAGDVVLVGGLLQDGAGDGSLAVLRGEVGRHESAFEVAGRDAVDEDVGREAPGHALGEVVESGLGDGVCDGGSVGSESRDRGDVDDSPSTGCPHRLDDLLDGPHGAGEIDVDDLVPQFVGQAVDIGEVDGLVECAVVHENVDAAELR